MDCAEEERADMATPVEAGALIYLPQSIFILSCFSKE